MPETETFNQQAEYEGLINIAEAVSLPEARRTINGWLMEVGASVTPFIHDDHSTEWVVANLTPTISAQIRNMIEDATNQVFVPPSEATDISSDKTEDKKSGKSRSTKKGAGQKNGQQEGESAQPLTVETPPSEEQTSGSDTGASGTELLPAPSSDLDSFFASFETTETVEAEVVDELPAVIAHEADFDRELDVLFEKLHLACLGDLEGEERTKRAAVNLRAIQGRLSDSVAAVERMFTAYTGITRRFETNFKVFGKDRLEGKSKKNCEVMDGTRLFFRKTGGTKLGDRDAMEDWLLKNPDIWPLVGAEMKLSFDSRKVINWAKQQGFHAPGTVDEPEDPYGKVSIGGDKQFSLSGLIRRLKVAGEAILKLDGTNEEGDLE